MTTTPRKKHVEFGGPARYRVVVEGTLYTHWKDRLGDLKIATTIDGDGVAHTTLSGPFADQAALNGLLDTLYGLHLPIIRVEQIDEDNELDVPLFDTVETGSANLKPNQQRKDR
jgi:hypothetical protein